MECSINPNEVYLIPNNIGKGFCVFGEPSEKIQDWISYHKLASEKAKSFTNIYIPQSTEISTFFEKKPPYKYVDGFSPNLNKKLHIGHFSNFVLANTFQKLGIGEKFIAIMGDTLGTVDGSMSDYLKYCYDFGYTIDEMLFASEQKLKDNILQDGEGKYDGCKVFDIDGTKIVGIKSDGSTSYFYQDIALAQYLHAPTLYMTGYEQFEHFALLKKLYPNIDHLPLGLVKISGLKLSSREGNVIYMQDTLDYLNSVFGNEHLSYNIFAGHILKSTAGSDKNINMDTISNVKTSLGLYLSYTTARLLNAGMNYNDIENFNDFELEYSCIKACNNLDPSVLFHAIISVCKNINHLYMNYTIKDNEDNKKLYQPLFDDVILGIKKLGLNVIYTV